MSNFKDLEWTRPPVSRLMIALLHFVAGASLNAGSVVAINAGGPTVGSFIQDENFTGGGTAYYPNSIDTSATPDVPQEVYRSERWGEVTYTFANIVHGTYSVRLYFAEIYFASAGQRKFHVIINGNLVVSDFDIIAASGSRNRAIALEFATSPSALGQVVVQLRRGSADYPAIGALQLLVPDCSNTPPTANTVFSPTSFWYTPIPPGAPLHTNSTNFVAEFLRQKNAYYGTVSINTNAYSSPVYTPDPTTTPIRVTPWDCQNRGFIDPGLAPQWDSVPIPTYAEPADGTDSEMTIFDRSSGKLWEFWQARKVNGLWQACWGGGMKNVSTNPGIWPYPYGAAATGLPFIGGQITAEELQRGEINHVIGISLVYLETYSIFSWPANRSDGWNPSQAPNRIPEGFRFRLDPNVNVDSLNMHPVGKIIAKAAQKYGFVVWDKAGAITLRAKSSKSYTKLGQPDPYVSLFGGTPVYNILQGFPWDRLQFLPLNYGKP